MADTADLIDEDDASEATPAITVSGVTAAAILLMLLDETEAATILGSLEPDEVKSLGAAMFDSSNASEGEVESALDQFLQRTRNISALSINAAPRIRKVITQALGNVRADNILASIAPQSSAAALDILRWMEVRVIARILSEEHPQVSALVIAVLTPDVAARALEGLPDDTQSDLLYRAACLTTVNADAIADLERIFARYTDVKGVAPQMKLGGKSDIAKIVNAMPKPSSDRFLKSVKKRDKVMGQAIEDEMFIFENLNDLDAKSLGLLLRSVNSEVLTLALKGASQPLVDKALGSMSSRAAQGIRDDMADRGPTKRAEVEEAQKSIIMTARQLAEEGQLSLGGRGDDYV